MTVKELIEKLQKLNPELEVMVAEDVEIGQLEPFAIFDAKEGETDEGKPYARLEW